VRQAASGSCGFAIALHLIEMIGDPIDLHGCVFDRLVGAVRGLGRFVRGVERLCGCLLGARGGLLCARGRSLSLLGLLLVMRRASREREDENQ